MSAEFVTDLAVVIGIDAYDPAVGHLETPVRDAEAVATLLASRFGYEVILQCDGTATLAGLRTLLLVDLPQRVREGSRLLFYFAGHGVAQNSAELTGPQGYLVPYGATSDVKSHLSMSVLHEALQALPCRHLLVILDCCFGGSFRWAGQRPMYVPDEIVYEEKYRHWVRHHARQALTSAAHDEHALDTPDRRRGQKDDHSPFGSALLEGLAGEADSRPEGGDGIITLVELFSYVQNRLVPHQSPLMMTLPGHTKGEFVFRDQHRWRPLISAEREVHLDESLNPYRGLSPYRAEHTELFFGRGAAASELLQHARLHPLTVVVGPSGSGKSSLVQAGLLPLLRSHSDESWIIPNPMRVAGDPFEVLHGALTAGGPPPATEDLRDPGKAEAWASRWAADHSSTRLLLVLDQGEELVTRVSRSGPTDSGPLPEASARFLACLAALIRGGGGRVRVVVAVRSDYETDLDEGPIAPQWRAGRFVVPPLRREDLREIIEGPAARRALYFDDPRLVDRLVDEIWGMPGGLPLLSYALSQLYLAYLRDARGDRLLRDRDLQAIGGEPGTEDGAVAPGGIVRVLREGADKAVKTLPGDDYRATLWRVLLRMVNRVGTRTTRRQVPLDELKYPGEEENRRVTTVLERFVDEARLLVSDRNGDRDLIEPAHDELLAAWPALVQRIEAARVHLPVHRRLTEAATEWSAPAGTTPGRRKRDLDLRLLGLVEASGLPEDWLNKAEADYVAAARRERRRRTVLRWSVAAAVLLVTTGAALFFRYQSQRNERLRYQAIIQGLANQAEADLDDGQTEEGLLFTRQAFVFLPQSRGALAGPIDRLVRRALDAFFPSRDNDQENRIHGLFRRALDDLPPSRIVLRASSEDPEPLAFHPGGRLLAAGLEGKLVLMILPAEGIVPARDFFPVPGGPSDEKLTRIAFSTDGRLLAAGFDKGSLCIWRLAGTPPIPIRGDSLCTPAAGRGIVTGLAFRPRTPVFVVGREGGDHAGNVQFWEVTDGPEGSLWLERRSERSAPGAVLALAVSTGEMFVSIKDPAQVVRGPIDDANAPFQLLKSPADRNVDLLGLDASGRLLAGTALGKILIWRLPSGDGPMPLSRRVDVSVWTVNPSTGGFPFEAARLVTVDSDGTLSRIGGDALTEENGTRSLCSGSATELAVEPKGGRVAVSCDGVLRLWDLRTLPGGWIQGIGRVRLPLSSTPTALTVRPGTPFPLAVGFANGDVELYNPAAGKRAQWKRPSIQGSGLDPEVHAILWSPAAGYRVLGNDGLWWRARAEDPDLLQGLRGPVCAAAGSADGAWLAALIGRPLNPAALKVWPASGHGDPVLLPSQRREGYFCDPGLAFHPTRTELAVGEDTDVILWSLTAGGQWQPRRLAETEGRIYAVAWNGDLLAVGGRGISSDGSITLLHGSTGEILHRWTIPGLQASRLAFAPGGRRLVAGTSDGALRIWNLEDPGAPPIVLLQTRTKIEFFAFLDPDRLAAVTGQDLTIWSLGTERLADAACSTLSENLGGDSWTSYVDTDLSQYEPACPGLGANPFLLSDADLLAETGNEAHARRIYRRLNKLKTGTVVDPFRRAYSERLVGKLMSFKGSDRQDVLAGMAQAQEYDRLRRREGLPELRKEIQLLLCRRGALLGEPARALPFCDNAVRLFPDSGMARDSRGLARALVGDLCGARDDFLASRNWQEDPTWRARRQEWIDALADLKNPITQEVLREIAREERGMTVDNVARPGGRYYYTSRSPGAGGLGIGSKVPGLFFRVGPSGVTALVAALPILCIW